MKDNLKNKLYQYEAEPSQQVWDAIAAGLDKNEPHSLKNKLYQFEEAAPEEVWNHINKQLGNTSNTLPFYKRYTTPLKYMAAAVIVFFIATGVLFLYNQKNRQITTFSSRNSQQHKKIYSPEVSEIRSKKPDNRSVTAPKITAPGSADQQKFIKGLNPEANDAPIKKIPGQSYKKPSSDRISNTVIITEETPDRYMTFNDNKGKSIKISRKLYNWMDCAYHLNVEACQKKIKRYQAKMAAPTTAPATDFIGIIEALQDLKENR